MGHVSSKNIKAGLLSAGDKQKIMETCATIHGVDTMYLWDQPNAKLTDVVSVCRQMVRKEDARFFSFRTMRRSCVPGAQDRRQAAEETSMTMKEIARDLQVPVVHGRTAQEGFWTAADSPTSSGPASLNRMQTSPLIHHEYAGDDPYKIERLMALGRQGARRRKNGNSSGVWGTSRSTGHSKKTAYERNTRQQANANRQRVRKYHQRGKQ